MNTPLKTQQLTCTIRHIYSLQLSCYIREQLMWKKKKKTTLTTPTPQRGVVKKKKKAY